MEVAAGVAAPHGGSLPIPSSCKEWRAVSDLHHIENVGDELDLEQTKLGQSDERIIYEHGRERADIDFSMDNDLLQRLHDVARRREDLQHLELDLRAQVIARSEIKEMQSNFESQVKEHVNAASKIQEQLLEREQTILELERKMEEKDRELHAIKLDNEAAWAKEDLFIEQKKELATVRREFDHSEAERGQHIQQRHDLQEHIQEKERQLIDLQEQHRVAQETIMYKDEQLREAQAWVARVQLQSNTNQSLQAELRERTEQFNQLWLGCQKQFAEMEGLHLHTIQQLQHELADARERSGVLTDDSRISKNNLKDAVEFGPNNGNQADANGGALSANTVFLSNGKLDKAESFGSSGNASSQTDRVPGVAIGQSSLLGLPPYLPPGQVPAVHSFIMHQHGVPHSLQSHVPQSHVGHFHSMPTISSPQQWQNQQAASDGSQNQHPPSHTDQNHIRPDVKYDISVIGQTLHSGYLDVHVSQGTEPASVISSSVLEAQVLDSMDKSFLAVPQSDQSLQQISSQFHDGLRLNTLEHGSECKEQRDVNLTCHRLEGELATAEKLSSVSASPSSTSIDLGEAAIYNCRGKALTEALISTGQMNPGMDVKALKTALLDERSVLTCIVRTIPAGGRIHISSTLPSRLGKMLAPLLWHDYKKQYGKLDDFVASHPELFVIEGDYIHLREGAQEMVAATAAVAKVAAAAAASSPSSTFLPPVAVTPMAQSRLKKVSSIDSNHVIPNHNLNGVSFGMAGGLSNLKILSKPREPFVVNGTSSERSCMVNTQSKGSAQGRSNSNFVGKQQSRPTVATLNSRR